MTTCTHTGPWQPTIPPDGMRGTRVVDNSLLPVCQHGQLVTPSLSKSVTADMEIPDPSPMADTASTASGEQMCPEPQTSIKTYICTSEESNTLIDRRRGKTKVPGADYSLDPATLLTEGGGLSTALEWIYQQSGHCRAGIRTGPAEV
ncbi:hypothetical protein Bbelb_140360 [Branchiostoma belcheri]|nr:hypothetical protein Bbelb_140360 [Branchiostoma belcheri]